MKKSFALSLVILVTAGLFKVLAQTLPGCGTMSAPVITSPSVSIQSASTAGITLNWTNVGATSYGTFYKLSTASQYTTGCATSLNGITCANNALSLGNTYNFYVNATRGCKINSNETDVDSQQSGVITITLLPPVPVNLGANAVSPNSFTATWSPSAGTSSYQLDVSTNNTFSGFVVNNLSVSTTSQSVSGLIPNTTYYFRVRAVNSGGVTTNSQSFSTTTLTLPVPLAPTNLVSSSVGQTSFTATWLVSTYASGYRLDVSSNSSFSSGNVLTDISVSSTSQIVSGLTAGTNYFFRVRAVNASGTSLSSSAVSTITLPPTPTGISAGSTTNSFVAAWSASPGASSYRIDVSINSSFTPTTSNILTDATVSSISQVVTGLTAGTTYFFRVRAVNASGASPNSVIFSLPTICSPPHHLGSQCAQLNFVWSQLVREFGSNELSA